MNIKINKKLVALLLSGTMSFTLASCGKQKDNYDKYIENKTYIDVLKDVEKETAVDERLHELPGWGKGNNEEDLYTTVKRLEGILNKYTKLKNIGEIDAIDPVYSYTDIDKVSSEEIDELIEDLSDSEQEVRYGALLKLADCKAYYESEISNYGVQAAYEVLATSILGVSGDAVGVNVGMPMSKDVSVIPEYIVPLKTDPKDKIPPTIIVKDNEYYTFYDEEAFNYVFEMNDYMEYVAEHPEEYRPDKDYLICTTALDYAKGIIARGAKKKGNKIIQKRK